MSPAQDDRSIVDPERSPIPFSMWTRSLRLIPSPKGKDSYEDEVVQTTSPLAKRQQSLSELKDAFTPLRDINGVDVSSIAGS